jgi:hypothetical protein
MKRDMDLIRKVMLWIEEKDELPNVMNLEVSEDVLKYHVLLLNVASLVFGCPAAQTMDGNIFVHVTTTPRLTWKGHEFIDRARDDSIWQAAKDKIKKAGGTVSFNVLARILAELVVRKIGM